MAIDNWWHVSRPKRRLAALATAVAMALVMGLVPAGGVSGEVEQGDNGESGACSATTRVAFDACWSEVRADDSIAVGNCLNVDDDDEREECLKDARASRREGDQLCRAQRVARHDVCAILGDEPYEPDFDPELFESDFTNLAHPNRYFPLRIGNRWEYRGGPESVTIEVRNETKLIEDVRCLVVRDRVTVNGDLIEDTDDWFAQAKDGDVYYCGEEVKDYETFEGDSPRRPELVSIDGFFKAGTDDSKAGIIFRWMPTKGDVYRQEFALGNAEDLAEVLSTTYSHGSDPTLDQFVPRAFAQLLCLRDCVVTKEYTPLDPGVFERKFYAPGLGLILEVNPGTGEVLQLVGCNFDPRCATLPTP